MSAWLLRSTLVALCLSAFVLLTITGVAAADPVVPGEEHCVVNVQSDDALNMRAQPDPGAQIVARKRYGECGTW